MLNGYWMDVAKQLAREGSGVTHGGGETREFRVGGTSLDVCKHHSQVKIQWLLYRSPPTGQSLPELHSQVMKWLLYRSPPTSVHDSTYMSSLEAPTGRTDSNYLHALHACQSDKCIS